MALLYISSSFSSFLPSTCLTSLTSHLHFCGLTFVHPFINVARLLYIIMEKKMNSILLFRSSYFSKPISLCWLLSTCPTSSFNELSKRIGWTCKCRHPTISPSNPHREEIQLNSSVRIYPSQASTKLNLFHYLHQH